MGRQPYRGQIGHVVEPLPSQPATRRKLGRKGADPYWTGYDFDPGPKPVRTRPWLVQWLTGEQRDVLANRELDRRFPPGRQLSRSRRLLAAVASLRFPRTTTPVPHEGGPARPARAKSALPRVSPTEARSSKSSSETSAASRASASTPA